ncbi:hypothetical protein [Actinoplanes sp. URMC 104]
MAVLRLPPHADGGAVLDTARVGPTIIVLGPSDPVPAGTAAGTVIIRRAS